MRIVFFLGFLLAAPAFAQPLTTKPNVSNTLSQCLTSVPLIGAGAGSSPVCAASALGTAAFANTGTSGATLGFLNTANTWLLAQTFTVAPVFSDASGTRTALGLGTAAVQNTGTSGANLPFLNGTNTWSGVQSFNSGDVVLKGATSGSITVNAAAIAGSNTLTFPAGTTDFSGTGGTSQVVKQTSSGGAFTVARLACADLSDSASGCSSSSSSSGANPTATLGLTATNGSAVTFLRSDGAPALSQAIVPTWTGIHTFSAAPVFNALPTGTAVSSSTGVSTLVARDGSGNFSAGAIVASLVGNASSATTATNGTTVATTTNASFFPLFAASSTNSNQPFNLDTTFTYNPSTDTVTATNFAGNATTATTATTGTNATNTAVTDDTTTNATVYPTWVTANTGNLPQKVSSTKLSFNPSTGVLTATSFVGALTSTNFANPSASAGLSAVNGSAVTAMRSDGAPAISQSIVPTWTGKHTFGSAGYPTTWSGVGAGTTILLGSNTLNGGATPNTLDMGGDYSTTAGANPKLKMLNAGGSVYGIGVSVGFLEFIGTSGVGFAFYPNGSATALANITSVGDFRSTPRTVGTLGTCNAAAEGTRAGVTDALAPTFLGTLVGGGTVHTSAYCNGTNWVGG